jgi:hypothetical protein
VARYLEQVERLARSARPRVTDSRAESR